MSDKEWIVTAIESAPGQMTLCFYEKNKVDDAPGMIICKELTVHEMEHVCEVAFRCSMFQVKNLIP